jgi:hypothetical protein
MNNGEHRIEAMMNVLSVQTKTIRELCIAMNSMKDTIARIILLLEEMKKEKTH